MARALGALVKLLLVLLVACGDNVVPDDGFGELCEPMYSPTQIHTECETETGAIGICAGGVCRRFCDGTEESPSACPPGQRAIPTVENLCWCE